MKYDNQMSVSEAMQKVHDTLDLFRESIYKEKDKLLGEISDIKKKKKGLNDEQLDYVHKELRGKLDFHFKLHVLSAENDKDGVIAEDRLGDSLSESWFYRTELEKYRLIEELKVLLSSSPDMKYRLK